MEIGGVSFGGLASGIDTKALIDAIIKAERRPIERLEARQSSLGQRKSALDEMRTKLSGFLDTLENLGSKNVFNGRTTTVGQEGFFTASAGPGKEVGVFSVEVVDLAAAGKVKSNGLASSTEGLVTTGTITLQSGENDPITIDVSAAEGNNNLASIRDAINDADAGVQASVLFDGAEYRLIVRAEETGVDNALNVTDTTNLGLDLVGNEITAASDALIRVDGIEVTSASNRVSGVIEGITLDLLGETTTPVSLQVAEDIDGVIEAVNELADSYNEVARFFGAQFDRENPGALANDSFARGQMLRLQTLVTSGVDGIPFGEIRSLASIGVGFDGRSGELSVDTGKLRELLESQFDDVGRLFEASGAASDPLIDFVSASSSVETGEYAVEISQAAEQASVVGSKAIKAQGIKNDETLTIDVGGNTIDVDLLKNMKIGEVVDTVNAALTAAGLEAEATDDGGKLRISTLGVGSDATITVTSSLNDQGNGLGSGFDDSPTSANGVDVAGTIGGEAATGAGRFLTGQGITILVNATADDIAAAGGSFGTVSYTPGLSDRIVGAFDPVVQFGDGQIDSSQDVIDDQLRAISDEIARIEERLAARETRLVRTFAAAEQAIALLQSQQSQLGSFFPF